MTVVRRPRGWSTAPRRRRGILVLIALATVVTMVAMGCSSSSNSTEHATVPNGGSPDRPRDITAHLGPKTRSIVRVGAVTVTVPAHAVTHAGILRGGPAAQPPPAPDGMRL